MVDVIGWVSSLLVVLTIGRQLQKQWRSQTSQGVSKWLFLGQFAASVGFVVYSVQLDNWVFVVTNAFLGLEAVLGFAIVLYHRRLERRGVPGTARGTGSGPLTGLDPKLGVGTAPAPQSGRRHGRSVGSAQ